MAKGEPGKSASVKAFAVAPMAPIYVLITGVLLAIPVIWAILAVTDPSLRRNGILMSAGFTAVAAAAWVYLRPSRFVVADEGMRIEWPLRTLEIERSAITHVRTMPRTEMGAVFGRTFRVGLGGLFGNFGLLWTSNRGWVSAYLTSRDTFVFVERKGARPMLISPAEPEEFVRALKT